MMLWIDPEILGRRPRVPVVGAAMLKAPAMRSSVTVVPCSDSAALVKGTSSAYQRSGEWSFYRTGVETTSKKPLGIDDRAITSIGDRAVTPHLSDGGPSRYFYLMRA